MAVSFGEQGTRCQLPRALSFAVASCSTRSRPIDDHPQLAQIRNSVVTDATILRSKLSRSAQSISEKTVGAGTTQACDDCTVHCISTIIITITNSKAKSKIRKLNKRTTEPQCVLSLNPNVRVCELE